VFSKLWLICCLVTLSLSGEAPNWSIDGKKEGWNQDELVKTYFYHSELQRQWAWELLGRIRLKGDERILDFGSGDGKITAEISQFLQKGSIKGVDISNEMVHFAQARFPKSICPHLEFAEINSLSDLNENYDIIFSFCVLHVVPDPLQILTDLHGKLIENGKLYLVTPCGKNPEFFQAAEETFAKFGLQSAWKVGTAKGASIRTLEGSRELLEQAHFKIERLEMVDTENLFIDTSEFLEWLKGTLSANWNVPFPQSHDFFSEVIKRLAELDPHLIDEQGVVHYKLSRIHVEATKSS